MPITFQLLWNKSPHTLKNKTHHPRIEGRLRSCTGQPTNKISQKDPVTSNNSSHKKINRNWTNGCTSLTGESVRPVTVNQEYIPLGKPEILEGAPEGPTDTTEYIPLPGNHRGGQAEGMEGASVRPSSTEEHTPVSGKSVRPEQETKHQVDEPKKVPGKMRVRVKGIEVKDMRSYLAKKKQDRDQKEKGDKIKVKKTD